MRYPKYLKLLMCFLLIRNSLGGISFLLKTITFVLLMFISRPNCWLELLTAFRRVWRSFALSARITLSSASYYVINGNAAYFNTQLTPRNRFNKCPLHVQVKGHRRKNTPLPYTFLYCKFLCSVVVLKSDFGCLVPVKICNSWISFPSRPISCKYFRSILCFVIKGFSRSL